METGITKNYQVPLKLTVNKTELAEMLSISRPLVYQIVKRSDFPQPLRINSRELYYVEDIREWIKKQTQKE